MAEPTQKHRFASIETPLGEDRLLLRNLTGREEMGRPFDYSLTLLDPQGDLDPNHLIGLNSTVRIQVETGEADQTRYINGFITSLSFLGYQYGAGLFHARLVPWLGLLTRTSDCRSFQERTVPQILEEVFTDFGFKDFRFDLTENYQPKPFCVQYNETAFNFVSRIMENEGMYYWWQHENGKHTMVITDSATTHGPHPLRSQIEWRPRTGVFEDGYLYNMRLQKTVSPGAYALNDYNFKSPQDDLRAKQDRPKPNAVANFAHFEYPGYYRERGNGERLSSVRLQEAQVNHETIDAEVTARAMAAGYKFQLTRAERADQERGYLIVGSSLSLSVNDYAARGTGSGDRFEGHIHALPEGVMFRPARITPKPTVTGPQPGLVVGPAGEEIYCDEYGRVKVHFYWDRRSHANQESSKWVRVSQSAAGGGYGFMSLPRVGQEVLVEFMNGDPDQPIITGRVYNKANEHPYDPKELKTRSSWKTNTYPGGGGFNEMRFEDSKGKEQIFIHGQKDLDTRILEKHREFTGISKHVTVTEDHRVATGQDKHENISRHHIENVDGEHSSRVGGNDVAWRAKDSQLFVGANALLVTQGQVNLNSGGEVSVTASKKLVVEAPSITLNAGNGNFVKIDASGVTIVGTMVMINSGGSPEATTPQAYRQIDTPEEPEKAADAPAGKVESSKGMGQQTTADAYPAQTVSDFSSSEGQPFQELDPATGGPALQAPPDDGDSNGLNGLTSLAGPASSALSPISNPADSVSDLLKEAVDAVKDATNLAKNAEQNLAEQAGSLVREATAPIQQAADSLKDAVNQVKGAVVSAENAVKGVANTVRDTVKDAANEVTQPVKEMAQTVKEASTAVKDAAQSVQKMAQEAKTAAQTVARETTQAVQKALQTAVAPVKQAAQAIQQTASALQGLQTQVKGIASSAGAAVKEALAPLKEASGAVKDAERGVSRAAQSIKDSLHVG
ncbi:MAG TPA: type VI secretion system tip protein TssI/VgrG [Chthoniobacter sp.]|jgi:type VI secretion system secreted protein VgrG